ncbi:carbohydrate ABC transporter permease [Ruania alba]|uniref:carbohydrate ABC transporter permease n=1 Tax=Ruania alba TaxID=648782 RepID=UPI001587824C|nr:carbohydrate ABC transporter permease [Ruania alba]
MIRRAAGSTVIYGVMTVVSLATVIPLMWMVFTSLKAPPEYVTNPWLWPREPQWGTYITLFTERGFSRYFLNSILVTVPSVSLILLLGAMAAYGLVIARPRTRSRTLMYFVIGQMIPVTAIIAPLYVMLRTTHLINSYLGLILTFVAGAMSISVFLTYGFFRAVPREIADAASIDGAGRWRTFASIYLPLGAPGLATVGIFQVLSVWNEILLVILIMQRNELQTLNVAVFQAVGEYGTDIPALFAGLTVAALPVVIVYLLFTRQFVAGLTAGATKG